MTNPYNTDLDRNPANFQPLTPLTFLERAASVFPEQVAIIHGQMRLNYRDFYRRSRQLASAFSMQGLGRGDAVPVLKNRPDCDTELVREPSKILPGVAFGAFLDLR